jgi:hypothetical protein
MIRAGHSVPAEWSRSVRSRDRPSASAVIGATYSSHTDGLVGAMLQTGELTRDITVGEIIAIRGLATH